MNISPEDTLEREESPASSLIGGSEGGKLAEYEEIAARACDGFVVRKDLVGQVKGNAIVPSYVLEFLLAQYCATTSETAIVEGTRASVASSPSTTVTAEIPSSSSPASARRDSIGLSTRSPSTLTKRTTDTMPPSKISGSPTRWYPTRPFVRTTAS